MDDGVTATTVIVGIVAGIGGAVISTALRIGYEREENLRARMIAAADDFSIALARALLRLNETHSSLEKGTLSKMEPSLEEGRLAMNEAHTRLGRVELLFGDESKAGSAAIDAIVKLRAACKFLTKASSKDDLGGYTEAYDQAHSFHLQFSRAVRVTIRPWWKRWSG
jgi:hypothetical protein